MSLPVFYFSPVKWGRLMRRFSVALIAAISAVAFTHVDYSPNDAATIGLFGPVTPPGPGYAGNQAGAPPPTSLHSSGLLGGLQLGYNWQFHHNWLIGG
jgi:hypothetical protein